LNEQKSSSFPKWLVFISIIVGVIAVYMSIQLFLDGSFKFKGSSYSSEATPITFWAQSVGLLLIGILALLLPFIPNRWFK